MCYLVICALFSGNNLLCSCMWHMLEENKINMIVVLEFYYFYKMILPPEVCDDRTCYQNKYALNGCQS